MGLWRATGRNTVAAYTKRQQLHEHEVAMDRPDETVSRGFLGAGVSRAIVPNFKRGSCFESFEESGLLLLR